MLTKNRELSGELAFIYRQCSDLLCHTLWMVKPHATEVEYIEYRKSVARVLGELGDKLLYPIYIKYPDLEPTVPLSANAHAGQASEKEHEVESPPESPKPDDPNP